MSSHRPGSTAPLRLLIVDDHPAVREGLSRLLSSEGMEVCAEAGSGADALAQVEACHPDVAIVDLSLDGEDGLRLVADFRARAVRTLVYSMHSDATHVEGAFAAGALGYVTKAEFRGVLIEAIQAVSAGRRFVSPVAGALSERSADPAGHGVQPLSSKEYEVYRLIGQGEGTYEIAAALKISTHTVESYYSRIRQKLGLEGMYELRRHAINLQQQR
jgi:DNA-binding NarL/FixJ family response regulator